MGLDVLHLGSMLSLRSCGRLGSTLSVLDFLYLGSSLSLRSFMRLGSSFAVSRREPFVKDLLLHQSMLLTKADQSLHQEVTPVNADWHLDATPSPAYLNFYVQTEVREMFRTWNHRQAETGKPVAGGRSRKEAELPQSPRPPAGRQQGESDPTSRLLLLLWVT